MPKFAVKKLLDEFDETQDPETGRNMVLEFMKLVKRQRCAEDVLKRIRAHRG